MKTAFVLLGVFAAVGSVHAAVNAERGATLTVASAVVCGRGATNDDAVNDLNLKLGDEKGVQIDSNGITLVVKSPFSVSAPVFSSQSTLPAPCYATTRHGSDGTSNNPVVPGPILVNPQEACVTVTSLGDTPVSHR